MSLWGPSKGFTAKCNKHILHTFTYSGKLLSPGLSITKTFKKDKCDKNIHVFLAKCDSIKMNFIAKCYASQKKGTSIDSFFNVISKAKTPAGQNSGCCEGRKCIQWTFGERSRQSLITKLIEAPLNGFVSRKTQNYFLASVCLLPKTHKKKTKHEYAIFLI